MKIIVFTLITLMMSVSYAGLKTKVAVIDSGFSGLFATSRTKSMLCKTGHFDYTTNTANVGFDAIGHGTFVSNLIVENANRKDICIVVFKVNVYNSDIVNRHVTRALIRAHKLGVKAVNISLGVPVYSHIQKNVMRIISKRGMKIFVSAGNSGKNLNKKCDTYPACYAGGNIYAVGSKDRSGLLETYSNRGAKVHIYEYGTIPGVGRGTSFASPRALARYLREMK